MKNFRDFFKAGWKIGLSVCILEALTVFVFCAQMAAEPLANVANGGLDRSVAWEPTVSESNSYDSGVVGAQAAPRSSGGVRETQSGAASHNVGKTSEDAMGVVGKTAHEPVSSRDGSIARREIAQVVGGTASVSAVPEGGSGKGVAAQSVDRESAVPPLGGSEVRINAAGNATDEGTGARVVAKARDAELQAEIMRLQRELAAIKAQVATSEAEKIAALAERDMMSNGLGRLLEELQKKDRQISALQLRLAGMLDMGRESDAEQMLSRVLKKYGDLAKQGEVLGDRVTQFCSKIDDLLAKSELSSLELAEYRLGIDLINRELQKFGSASAPADRVLGINNARIVAINRELGVVALSVGSNQGVFLGLGLRPVDDTATRLIVVSVRAEVCAAIVSEGEITTLAPGMEVQASREEK